MDQPKRALKPKNSGVADAGRRQKLKDITSKVNNHFPASPRKLQRRDISPQKLPHHASLQPGGDLQYLTAKHGTQPATIENKRLSAVADSQRSSKRYSQSSASTNASVEFTGRKRKSRVGPWLLGSTLGQGATCRVRKAKHTATGLPAAIKIVSRNVAKDQRSESVVVMDNMLAADSRWQVERRIPFNIEREVLIMKLIQHPNVIRLYDVWENRGEIYLVLEYVENGELFSYIMEHGRLPEEEAIRIFRQIIAGLEHCHFYNLCHRDLKPENILMDSENNVKIADFGMASVQHSRWLRTSCGSPHYAAPEVVSGGKYDGERADIWSAGVVFYVMLVGRQPFGSECEMGDPATRDAQLKEILRQVVSAEVVLPSWISDEAEDLIVRILDPNPRSRITIKGIWEHPLLRKYEGRARREGWLGDPQLNVSKKDCGGPIPRQQMDMDVIASLCMLWHTTSEQTIIKKLCSPEPNHERLLYHRLLESRREQEENFQGAGVEVSSSDYHHVGRRRHLQRSATRASSQSLSLKTHQSQFSIAEGGKRRASSRTVKTASEPETDRSYDPFRASRTPMVGSPGEGAKVTLLRGSSAQSRGSGATGSYRKAEHPALTRIRDDTMSRFSSSPPQDWPRDANGNLRTLRHTGGLAWQTTKSSLGSSTRSQKSARFRSSFSYKRGVSFAHIRRRSSSSCPPPARPDGPSPTTMKRKYTADQGVCSSSLVNTPSIVESKLLHPSREEDDTGTNRFSAYLTEEARQVSRELEKFCEDAFRESVSELNPAIQSSECLQPRCQQSSVLPKTGPIPPPRKSSINQSGRQSIPLHGEIYRNRPLPELPGQNSLSAQRLRKYNQIRNTILKTADDLPHGALVDAMRTVEDLIRKTEAEVQEQEGVRISSAPTPNTKYDQDYAHYGRSSGVRHVSEPPWADREPKYSRMGQIWSSDHPTIRVVYEPISGQRAHTAYRSTETGTAYQLPYRGGGRWGDDQRGSVGSHYLEAPLDPIQEDEKEDRNYTPLGRGGRENKLRNWFRRSNSSSKSNESDQGPTPPAKDYSSTQHCGHGHPHAGYVSSNMQGMDDDIDPTGPRTHAIKKNRGLLGLFSKTMRNDPMFALGDSDGEDSFDQSTTDSGDVYASRRHANASNLSVQNRVPQRASFDPSVGPTVTNHAQNWLARFLKVKPGHCVMALQISKNAALKEIRAVLRDWKRHGMRDVISDRVAGKLWARVDVDNALNIKPVSLRVEFYTVLLHGRKHNLSLARFVQEFGAKSSFEKVTKTMEGVLRGRDILVTKRKKARKMRRCLKEWEQRQ